MQLETTRKKILLSQIKWQEKKYRTSYFADLSGLKQSISAVGILNPPIVQSISDENFRIVSGWRRLMALRELDKNFCEVFVLKDTSNDLRLLELVILENLSIREFNVMEKAIIIKNLVTEFNLSDRKIVENYLPLLKLGKNPKWLGWSQKLVDFPQCVQQTFANEMLSFDLIDFLEKINSEDREHFVNIINILKLGKNRQKELAMLLADLSRIKSCSLSKLFQEVELVKIIDHEKLTNSQKTAKLFEWLKNQRYPRYSEVEKKFEYVIRSLKIPTNSQIKHSPYFESDWYTLQFTFRNLDEFKKTVEFQNKINSEEQIGKLFHLTDRT